MDDGLKQRIIGAFVLLAIAIIFIPVIFDKERMEPVDRRSQIPPPPNFETLEISRSDNGTLQPSIDKPVVDILENDENVKQINEENSQNNASVEQDAETTTPATETPTGNDQMEASIDESEQASLEKAFRPDADKPEDLNPAEPSTGKHGIPNSWVLQVASFKELARAEALQKKLTEDGFRCYVKQVSTAMGAMHRVYVGPKLSKSVLLEHKQKIDKKYNVNGLLLRFSGG